MGMYTQVRGWLNVDSVGDYFDKRYWKIVEVLEKAKTDFQSDSAITELSGDKPLERKWVCNDTIVHHGGNGSVYLFFGTEIKNYGSPSEVWIKYLLKYFPNAEGRIDFQYEENEDFTWYWEIYKGSVIKEDRCVKWCYGYGNEYEIKE